MRTKLNLLHCNTRPPTYSCCKTLLTKANLYCYPQNIPNTTPVANTPSPSPNTISSLPASLSRTRNQDMVMRKDELEVQLKNEHEMIKVGIIRDDSPLDHSEEFRTLCEACRRGDSKTCQEMISLGTNINARDTFDNTPLILASLCGHYEVVRLLLESGALCERDTFQGERCLYNALNNRIRNLLLQYDYSKSSDPLQPWASHLTSLLTRSIPETSDITLFAGNESFCLHKFILSARSPYFQKKLASAPETKVWKLESSIPSEAFYVAIRYLYMGDVPSDLGINAKSHVTEAEVFKGIDKVCKKLEIESLWESILSVSDRRLARQRHQDEMNRGCSQLDKWYKDNIISKSVSVETSKVTEVKWKRDNAIFADVLLRADEPYEETSTPEDIPAFRNTDGPLSGIPVGPSLQAQLGSDTQRKPPRSILYPAHRAMLIRSEYFLAMFSSPFQEAQISETLHIIKVDCSPAVLEVILTFLYTETAVFSLDVAVDTLFTADMLLIEKLKTKAAAIISTLGNGEVNSLMGRTHTEGQGAEVELINIYDVMQAAWQLRVQRLEEFAARYFAYRLEDYIDEPEFEELIRQSAAKIEKRQETDTIELLDDIRYYLSERFRLRFEDAGLEEMMDEESEINAQNAETISDFNAEKVAENTDQAIDLISDPAPNFLTNGEIRTLDGDIVGDEFDSDAINYQILLGKIDTLLDRLKLDA